MAENPAIELDLVNEGLEILSRQNELSSEDRKEKKRLEQRKEELLNLT